MYKHLYGKCLCYKRLIKLFIKTEKEKKNWSKIHVKCMQICQRCQGLLQDINASFWKQMVDFVHIVSDTAGGLFDH
jgi:hypothetical protein